MSSPPFGISPDDFIHVGVSPGDSEWNVYRKPGESWEAMSRRAVAMKSRLDDVWEKHHQALYAKERRTVYRRQPKGVTLLRSGLFSLSLTPLRAAIIEQFMSWDDQNDADDFSPDAHLGRTMFRGNASDLNYVAELAYMALEEEKADAIYSMGSVDSLPYPTTAQIEFVERSVMEGLQGFLAMSTAAAKWAANVTVRG